MNNLYRGPAKDAFYQISIHLLTDREEMTNFYRGPDRCFLPSFGSFGKVVSE